MSADYRFRRRPAQVIVAVVGMLTSSAALAVDIFGTEASVPRSVASPVIGAQPCLFDAPHGILTLREAVERSVCAHPKTRQAWTEIKGQAAAVGVATAAFAPTVTITGQDIRDSSETIVAHNPALNSTLAEDSYTASASLAWTLYDFGARGAALDNASELLAAAIANHQDVLQTVFETTAKDFYSALAALGARDATRETEKSAADSLGAAIKRVDRGVAPLSDRLQAETAYFQAKVAAERAEGDLRAAIGTLASDIGLRPDISIELPSPEFGTPPDKAFNDAVAALIDTAVRTHPKVLLAEAQLRAAEAAVRQTDAEGLPRLSLVGKSTRDNRGVAAAQGLPINPATTQDNYVGLEIDIPLFEGFARDYKVKQAKAQQDAQAAAADEVRRQVSLDVWTSYHAVETLGQTVSDSERLLAIANESYAVAKRRYETGASSILELLNTQTALAIARRQRIQTLTDWRASRIDLAAKLGNLDLSNVE
jgi:outer membrane protein